MTPDLTDRVMLAVARERPPGPGRSLLTALRARSAAHAIAAVRTAWHLATVRAWHVPLRTRARAVGLVLAVTLTVGAGGVLAAGTVTTLATGIATFLPTRPDLLPPTLVDPSPTDRGPDAAGSPLPSPGERGAGDSDVRPGDEFGADIDPGTIGTPLPDADRSPEPRGDGGDTRPPAENEEEDEPAGDGADAADDAAEDAADAAEDAADEAEDAAESESEDEGEVGDVDREGRGEREEPRDHRDD